MYKKYIIGKYRTDIYKIKYILLSCKCGNGRLCYKYSSLNDKFTVSAYCGNCEHTVYHIDYSNYKCLIDPSIKDQCTILSVEETKVYLKVQNL